MATSNHTHEADRFSPCDECARRGRETDPIMRLCLVCLQDYLGSYAEHETNPAHVAAAARKVGR